MGGDDIDETWESYGTDVTERDHPLHSILDRLLLRWNRIVVTVALTVGAFLLLVGVHALGLVSSVNDATMTRISQGLIAGTFSLVTLVVTVNQLILSREFRTADEFRDRLGGVVGFRRDIEDATGAAATPAAPADLLELLVREIGHRADRVEESLADDLEGPTRTRLEAFVRSVREGTDRTRETLDRARFGTFSALAATMEYDDAWQIYAARHLRNDHEDELSDATREALEELVESLELLETGREHLKTTYLQRELTRLSQLTILLGIPAVLAAFLLGLLYGGIGGPTIGHADAPVVVSGLIAIASSPVALLSAYVLRAGTITRRTASIGPMLPQKGPDEGPFEVARDADGESE
ncbi:hypothetical protein GWG54_05665 [Natronococcus sp. JC468]|uniref:hypothetical protein n=1 Tax=Natronococcus sp. JC468 TaxID=1961921 RepID=UPI0014392D14|nr:hypothetical protein [Natronococcus sp. JC468]NKE35309.1 hypothetical protein [Natronococcus sp. JC468]